LANETETFSRKLQKYEKRQLNYRYYDWFKNETLYNEWLLVVEALEI